MAEKRPHKTHRPAIMGSRHMVSAGHHMAAQAGLAILEAGGNAIDAGVATGLATSVLESERVGLSSVAPIMVYMADTREVTTVSGLGPWPKAASCDYFVRNHDGHVPTNLMCTVVPGSPDAWIVALERWGTMSFGEVASAAIRLARDGFPMYHHFSNILKKKTEKLSQRPDSAKIFLPGGKAPETGDIFVQADFGRVMQYMADEERAAASKGRSAGLAAARDAFYKGDIAKTVDSYFRANGGWLTYDDMAAYTSDVEKALHLRFAGADVYACGPWCQGPMLLEILNLLSGYDLKSYGHNSRDYVHLIAEAIKLAAADREAYIADPKFFDVPLDVLLSPSYAKARRKMIRSGKAWTEMPPAGEIPGRQPKSGSKIPIGELAEQESALDTSYMCVVDRHGNAFSATPSDGCMRTPVVPGLGLSMSCRGVQSWGDPDHPASVAPGKRPRMTPNPAFAILEGGRVMPFGSPGGDVQPQTMTQVLINIAIFGMDPQTALEMPRFASFSYPGSFEPHEYQPGKLKLEPGIGEKIGEELAAFGHDVQWWPERAVPAGSACAIIREANGTLIGGADPRRVAYAVGW